MKTAPFTSDRRIGVAFLPDGDFGGDLVFRELLQAEDGSLRTTFPPEMIPPSSESQRPAASVSHSAKAEGKHIVLGDGSTPGSATMQVPDDFFLSFTLRPGTSRPEPKIPGFPTAKFSMQISGLDSSQQPSIARLEIDRVHQSIAWTTATLKSAGPVRLDGVEDMDKAIRLEVVAKGTLVDVNVNGRHTLVHRLPELSHRQVSFASGEGEAEISDLVVEPLSNIR